MSKNSMSKKKRLVKLGKIANLYWNIAFFMMVPEISSLKNENMNVRLDTSKMYRTEREANLNDLYLIDRQQYQTAIYIEPDIDISDEIVPTVIVEETKEIQEEIIPTVIVEELPEIQEEIIEENICYSGMKLSNELEKGIIEIAERYNVPYELVLAIGERESGGNWNSNGVISYTNDYGLFQINQCNLAYIEVNLGYNKEEILNEPLKNAEACIFLLNNILKNYNIQNELDVFGMYNGWTNWRNIPSSVNYAYGCQEILNNYFPNYETNSINNQNTK